ncbi:tetratricopeptide repeat protein [Kitasatospora griseola]|uniref:tetratricopeptide repeat protein n=1 Tax=Kitasatospora griseola TaxID=2064 RepID=UPI003855CA86
MNPEASGERSVAAGWIGAAVTGDVIGLPAEILNAARDVQAPPGLTNLPPAPLCLGREAELVRLHEVGDTAIMQASTVHGLGGVGKTTLALAYAHRYRHAYSAVWWINADSPTRIEQSLAELTRRLLPGLTADRDRVAWAMAWLQWHPGWLLVFDNVEAVADLSPYLGALGGGRHLITSRRAVGWPRSMRTLALGTLDAEQAVELIRATAYGETELTVRELQDVRALAAELGYLPLALEQAGAYLRQNPTVTIPAYYRRLPTKLDKAVDGLDAERTIARIWTQTLDALTVRDPRAVELLRTLAWLAPDEVPVGLLEADGVDPDEPAEALGHLAAYSMATVTRDTVSVHRLVQQVLRVNAPEGRREAEQAVVRALDGLDPEAGEWDSLIPQLIALAESRPGGHDDEAVTDLYRRAGWRLDTQGRLARATALLEAVVAQREQSRGELHPDTLATRNNLACAYRAAGDLGRAVPLSETVLAQCERVFGELHPHTLTSRNNLADAYQLAGDLGRAVPLWETVLGQCEQVLGELHPDTLLIRSNLACVYQTAGDPGRAVSLLETVLAQRERVLGELHRDTLTSWQYLADAYRAAGDPGRAVSLLETVLAQRERVLGELHPDTLGTRDSLASALRAAGDPGRAVPLSETVLAQREQVLGELHPHTLTSRNNLACAYLSSGDAGRAVLLFELVLAQREQVLSALHPHTLLSRGNLAQSYAEAGDPVRAVPLLEAVLAQREQVLGEQHPDTLISRQGLALACAMTGRPDRAIPLFEAVAAQYERTLGGAHPTTVAVRNQLARARREAGTG